MVSVKLAIQVHKEIQFWSETFLVFSCCKTTIAIYGVFYCFVSWFYK